MDESCQFKCKERRRVTDHIGQPDSVAVISILIRVDLFTYYIRQVNGVKLADIMFVLLFVGLCANVKQEDKWLASETHTFKATDFNLTCIFQGTVRAWPGSRNPLKFTCRIYAL